MSDRDLTLCALCGAVLRADESAQCSACSAKSGELEAKRVVMKIAFVILGSFVISLGIAFAVYFLL